MSFWTLVCATIILTFSLFNPTLHAKVRKEVGFSKDRKVSSTHGKNGKKKSAHSHRKRPTLERTVPEINILK